MRYRLRLGAALVVLVATLAGTSATIALRGAGGSVPHAAGGAVVAVDIQTGGPCGQEFCFSPQSITVNPGTTVTWSNTTEVTHTVTRCTMAACGVGPGSGTDPAFDSGFLGAGQTFSVTFSGLGTYVYYCQIHGYAVMNGTVTVVAPASGPFTSLAPARILDTRSGVGAPMSSVVGGGTVSLKVEGADGVPATGVAAVVLNVTVAQPAASGFITVYPDGSPRPLASNLNFSPGAAVPNLVVAPVGSDGKVDLYNGAPGNVQLVADVSGYFTSGGSAANGAFTSFLTSARLLDTRSGTGTSKGSVPAGGTVVLDVAGAGGVPASGAAAVVLNVTVAQPTTSGFITVYGDGTSRPLASNLNFVAGQTVPNLVVAPIGADGKVDLYNGSGGTVQLVADASGWFAGVTTPAGGAFNGLTPTRILDTRSGTGTSKGPVPAGGTVVLDVEGQGGIPATGVSAVVLNVTVTQPTTSGFITVYGDGMARPLASNLNFVAGQTVPNLVVAPIGADGDVVLYNGSGGTVQLVADASGWF